ncbi:MAG: arsenosugar biosynthesis radical SAM (seleno)protein ArsS [Candidatus Binatia bacterium]
MDAETRFEDVLLRHGMAPLARRRVETLQVNVGKLCNQACHHCHVDAGPKRTERMTRSTAERVLALLEASPDVGTMDVTGGAPELNPNFRLLVEGARRLGRKAIDRCNLTVLWEDGMEWLPAFLVEHGVELTCSLPCYTAKNVDQQRGKGVYDESLEALRLLNRLGYGSSGSDLTLNLVYNPVGPFLPPSQAKLEDDYKRELAALGIEFHRLFTITNMPIKRFAADLARSGREREYMGLLVNHFNPATIDGLMCRSLVSVGWDGRLYDCDFNQMLDIELPGPLPRTIDDLASLEGLEGAAIATASHCFGCTAGAGSSCGGETVKSV